MRSLAFWVFVLLFLVFVFSAVTSLENQAQRLGRLTPKVKCPKDVSEDQAIADFLIDIEKRNGMYHCFCLNMATKKGNTFANDYIFTKATQKEKNLCAEWVSLTGTQAAAAMAIPGMVAAINVGVELIIGYGSEYISRPRNYQQTILEAMGGICGIQFINLGILFVMVSIKY